jgi:hypothetical protein
LVGTTATWSVVGTGTNPPVAPRTGIGQAKFNSYDAPAGGQARLITPGVDLTTSADPYTEFFMYHDNEFSSNPDSVYLEATNGDSISGPWTLIAGMGRYSGFPGWRKEAASLLAFRGMSRVFVSLRGVSNFGNNMYVDDIRIADSSFHDIGVTELLSGGNIPSASGSPGGSRSSTQSKHNSPRFTTLFLGGTADPTLDAVVHNFGSFTEPSFQVHWTIDAQPQPPVISGSPLPQGTTDTLSLPWPSPSSGLHTIASWTSLPGDSNGTNDTSRIVVYVTDSTAILFETFNESTFPPAGWTVINRDGGTLPPWFRGTAVSPFLPFEGSGFAGNNFQRANNLYIDDYLISPPVPGVGVINRTDTLRFYARSVLQPPPQTNFPDSLMVLLSTGGTDTSDFTIPVDYFEVPKDGWSLRQYAITNLVPPNSTVHVAFRYLHFNGGLSGTSSDFVGVDAVQVIRTVMTDVLPQGDVPVDFAVLQNFPNPFNASTTLLFSLPTSAYVDLRIFDALGRQVEVLLTGQLLPGNHTRAWNPKGATGVYFCRLLAHGRALVRKVVYIR